MAIKPNDAKRLWGRAGARCALCRSELSAVGSDSVLGEMAHIVAQSDDGPRGKSQLSTAERDSYQNLILLCPTDHQKIDANTQDWTVERLHQIKSEHERWVQDLLDKGILSPVEIDSSLFRQSRGQYWESEGDAWSYIALTPLDLIDDAVDPLEGQVRQVIQESRLSSYLNGYFGVYPNPHQIEPNVNGLVSEDFSRLTEGVAYRIEVFRNGHVEYAVCLTEMLRRVPVSALEERALRRPMGLSNHRKVSISSVIRYQEWAETLLSQVSCLHEIWSKGPFPFNDMVLTSSLVGIEGACLLVSYGGHNYRVGRPAEKNSFTYSAVVSRKTSVQELASLVLRRFANFFGLDLADVFDEQGKLVSPTSMEETRKRL